MTADSVATPIAGTPVDVDRDGPAGPYVGLRPYRAAERNRFFGRDRDAAFLCNKVLSSRLTILYSQSGLGKSSLLRALVIPQLEQDARVIEFHSWSQDDPLSALKEKLAGVAANLGVASPEAGAPTLAELVRLIASEDTRPLTLILDQFEEFLTAHARELDPLRVELAELVRTAHLDAQIVLSMREEFLAALEPFREHILNLFQSTYRLAPLDAPKIRDAIQLPPGMFGGSCEPKLVDVLTRDLHGSTRDQQSTGMNTVELPLLQLVCRELWDEAQRIGTSDLTVALYERLGGVRKILDRYVASSMPSGWRDQVLTARLLRLLAPPSGFKMAYSAGDLADNVNESVADVDAILARLSQARILQSRHSKSGTRYELQHDAFIGVIAPWRDHVLNRRTRLRQTIVTAAVVAGIVCAALFLAIWNQSYRRTLERQSRLQGLVHRVENEVASRPIFNLLLAASAHVIARSENVQLQRSAESVLRRALSIVGGIPFAGPEGTGKMVALSPDGTRFVTAGERGAVLWESTSPSGSRPAFTHVFEPRALSAEPIMRSAISPGGRWLALASTDRKLRVWDLAAVTEQPREVLLEANASALTFSDNDQWLALGTEVGGAAVLDLRSPHGPSRLEPLARFPSLTGAAKAVAFNASGQLLAAVVGTLGDRERSVVLRWDIGAHRTSVPEELWNESTRYVDVAFGDDAQRLAALTNLDEVHVIEFDEPGIVASRGRPISNQFNLGGLVRSAVAVSLARRGSTLAVADRSGAIVLWDADARTWTRTLLGHGDLVTGLSVSEDNRWLASASTDGTTRLWDLDRQATHPWFLGATGREFTDLAFSHSPQWLVIAGRDGKVQRLDLARGSLAEALAASIEDVPLSVVAVTSDGRWLVAGGENGELFLWGDPFRDRPEPPVIRHRFSETVRSVAFSPDGRWLAAGSDDKSIQVWLLDSDASSPPGLTHRHDGEVTELTFSPDSRWLASGGFGGDVAVWELRPESGASISEVVPGHDRIEAMDFDRLGRLAIASGDGAVRLRNVSGKSWVREPWNVREEGTASPTDLAFSPDGRWLVVATTDFRMLRWQVDPTPWSRFRNWLFRTPTEVSETYESPVNEMAFSRDGRLAMGSSDGTVRIASVDAISDAVTLWKPPATKRIWKLVIGGSADDAFMAAIADYEAWLWMVGSPESRRGSDAPDEIVQLACRTAGLQTSGQTCDELKVLLDGWPAWDVCRVCPHTPAK